MESDYEVFSKNILDYAGRVRFERWDNDLSICVIEKRISGTKFSAHLVNGGLDTKIRKVSFTIPRENPDIMGTKLVVIRGGTCFATNARSVSELAKAAGISGTAIHEATVEGAVFLVSSMINARRIKSSHTAVILEENGMPKLVALKKSGYIEGSFTPDAEAFIKAVDVAVSEGYKPKEWNTGLSTENGVPVLKMYGERKESGTGITIAVECGEGFTVDIVRTGAGKRPRTLTNRVVYKTGSGDAGFSEAVKELINEAKEAGFYDSL